MGIIEIEESVEVIDQKSDLDCLIKIYLTLCTKLKSLKG